MDDFACVHIHPRWLENGFRVRVSKHHQVAILHHLVRKRVKLGKEQALFLFCRNDLILPSELIGVIYRAYSQNGVLDVVFCIENAFGHKSLSHHADSSVVRHPASSSDPCIFSNHSLIKKRCSVVSSTLESIPVRNTLSSSNPSSSTHTYAEQKRVILPSSSCTMRIDLSME